jgi:hypothetical protein
MAMVTRYSITDEVGRFLTVEGFFSYDDADAVEFRDEDEAIEELASYPGCTVETFQRFSKIPDFIPTPSIEKEAA